MLFSNRPPLMSTLLLFLSLFLHAYLPLAHNLDLVKGRTLMGFKETPVGGNVTFDCSPSGPCIPCSRSEKSDEKYRCGETGYRIRMKCAPSRPGSKDAKNSKEQMERSTLERKDFGVNQLGGDPTISSKRQGRLLGDSSKSKGASRYVTYRSCIPAVNEEKLSVLGFEALMLTLLISSGSFIYFSRKRSSAAAGGAPTRLPTTSRF